MGLLLAGGRRAVLCLLRTEKETSDAEGQAEPAQSRRACHEHRALRRRGQRRRPVDYAHDRRPAAARGPRPVPAGCSGSWSSTSRPWRRCRKPSNRSSAARADPLRNSSQRCARSMAFPATNEMPGHNPPGCRSRYTDGCRLDGRASARGAARWVESIRLAIMSLSDMPGRCPIASEYRGSERDVRLLVHGRRRHRYRILFEIGDDTVRILRIRHGAQAQTR